MCCAKRRLSGWVKKEVRGEGKGRGDEKHRRKKKVISEEWDEREG